MFRDVVGHEKFLETDGKDIFRKEFFLTTKVGNIKIYPRRKFNVTKVATLVYTVAGVQKCFNVKRALSSSKQIKNANNRYSREFAPEILVKLSTKFNLDFKVFNTIDNWELEFYAEALGVKKIDLMNEICEFLD